MRRFILFAQASGRMDALTLALVLLAGSATWGTIGALRSLLIQPAIGSIFGEPWYLERITINGSHFQPVAIISEAIEAGVILLLAALLYHRGLAASADLARCPECLSAVKGTTTKCPHCRTSLPEGDVIG